MEKKSRNSSFELLRIISMFFILMGHMSGHGIKHVSSTDPVVKSAWLSGTLINRLMLCIMGPGGRIGIMIFLYSPVTFCIIRKLKSELIS